ncbi:hypothetical protein SORBI_3003G125200 [Sorghum bicolor]|uniref:Uncharacterized protein n=1 Tax=Sorghum bicolor TaxID=4558 RepID=A0A1B6Q2S9_SORBI|nr:hypothetical protein SORBI_3003G125200 [Sorghum bicolor]
MHQLIKIPHTKDRKITIADPERTDGHRSIQTTLLFLLSSTTSRRQQQRPRRRPQFDQIQNPPVLTAVLDSLPVARRGCSVLNSIPHSCPVLLTRRRSRSIRFLLCCSDGPENSRCALLDRAHICTLGRNFYDVVKDGEGRCRTIEESFFLFY